MNFEQLKRRVERAEQVADGRIVQTIAASKSLQARWREAWTPPRIVVVGLLAGFVGGKAHPERALQHLGKVANPRMMQLVTSLTGLVTSLQTAYAAATAKDATDGADDAGDETARAANRTTDAAVAAGAVATPAATTARPRSVDADRVVDLSGEAATGTVSRPRSDRRRADPAPDRQPAPAEAATDLSER